MQLELPLSSRFKLDRNCITFFSYKLIYHSKLSAQFNASKINKIAKWNCYFFFPFNWAEFKFIRCCKKAKVLLQYFLMMKLECVITASCNSLLAWSKNLTHRWLGNIFFNSRLASSCVENYMPVSYTNPLDTCHKYLYFLH